MKIKIKFYLFLYQKNIINLFIILVFHTVLEQKN